MSKVIANTPLLRNIENRISYIEGTTRGERRVRSDRWEAESSVRDLVRANKFLINISNTESLPPASTFNTLASEIRNFDLIIGQNIHRDIDSIYGESEEDCDCDCEESYEDSVCSW